MSANSSINPISNTGANASSAISNINTASLFSGAPGLTNNAATGTGTDQVNLGDEAGKMMQSMGLGTTGNMSGLGGGDPTTMMIMMMMMMTMASGNNNMKSMMSQMSGTGTAGTTAGGTAANTAITGAGKLDTTGIQNVERKGTGGVEGSGSQVAVSGTVKTPFGTVEITPDKVRADGKPSAAGDGDYKTKSGQVFENKCPCCGKKGVMSYERGAGCPEGMFFCDQKKGGCDSDFSVIGGAMHIAGSGKKLTPVAGAATSATSAATGGGTSSTPQVNLPGVVVPKDEEDK